jgi:glycosyltransferase involved in cell wall biosynthesis
LRPVIFNFIVTHVLSVTYSLADQDFQKTKSLGIFNFSLQCLSHLSGHPRLKGLTVLSNSTLQLSSNLPDSTRTEVHDEAIAGRLLRTWWDQWGVYRAARRTKNEWLFLPKGFASFLRPCPVKLAIYVHDTILESYYAAHPGVSVLELAYFRRSFAASLKRARVIFTNSDFTCREIERAAKQRGLATPRLVNIGMGFALPPPANQARENRILVLAGAFPHKRTDLALEYLTQWQDQANFAGTVEWVGRLPAGLSLPEFSNWEHHARLAEAEFRKDLRRSQVLVFFSDYEGFGMPPVEAILQGVCPVYSEIPATREVMGGAGCTFQNDSYKSFAAALEAAMRMPSAQIGAWGQSLLKRFDWGRTCEQLAETLAKS